jgi:protease I
MDQQSSPPQHLLGGLQVAIVVGTGFEQAELVEPRRALQEAGAATRIVSVSRGRIQGFHHDQPGDHFDVDLALEEADAAAFDAVLIPGGVRNADMIRASRHAQQFVRDIDAQGKPLAVICHGPWLLVSAGLVRGRTLTSWPTLEADIRNAGGRWVDQPVALDRNWVSSRKPADIPQFNAAFIELLATRTHAAVAGTGDDTASATGVDG